MERLFELRAENERLKAEVSALHSKVSELQQKLTETAHWLTYISEQSNHREIEQEYPGDGPAPEMFGR